MTDSKVSAERQKALDNFEEILGYALHYTKKNPQVNLMVKVVNIRSAISQPEPEVVTVEDCLRRALRMTSTDHQDPVAFHICRALDYIDGYKKGDAP